MPKVRSSLRSSTIRFQPILIPPSITSKKHHVSMKINQLPAEVLLEIFEYLGSRDLSALTGLCRKFSSVISNSSLVNKFTLNFERDNQSREWIGQRKYSKLRIETEKGIFSILRSIGSDLQIVTIDIRSIDLKTIARIIKLCPNVKLLRFEDVKTHSFLNDMGKQELPKQQNIEVWIENTTPNIFELFKYMKISKLTVIGPSQDSDFESCYSTGDCRIAFTNFLKNQTDLEDLTLQNFKPPATLFNDRSIATVPFRLKKVKLKSFNLDNPNFHSFMENHLSSIKTVDIDTRGFSDAFLSFLERCPNFRELIFCGNMITARPLPNVEKLNATFVAGVRFNWHVSNFPNLKELKIRSENYQSATFANFESFKKLEKLEIFGSHFSNMRQVTIPSVKQLILRHVTCDYPRVFDFATASLDVLVIDNCTSVWLPHYLSYPKVNLKKLIVANTNVNVSCRKYIEGLKSRIQHVEIINCTSHAESYEDHVQKFRNKLKM